MRTSLSVLCLLLATACSHAPVTPPPAPAPKPPYVAPPMRPPNPAYEQRVRETLVARGADVRACYEGARDGLPQDAALASSFLYVSPQLAYLPRPSQLPALASFERCVVDRLRAQGLPAQVGDYSAAWLRIHLRPASSPEPREGLASLGPVDSQEGAQLLLEVSGSAPDRVTATRLEPGAVPDHSRDVFALEGQKTTRPRELSGKKVNYTQAALVNRVSGVMRVKCIITYVGTVQDCRILEPLPFMEADVLLALSSKRYTPVTFEGTALNVEYTFTIELKLPH